MEHLERCRGCGNPHDEGVDATAAQPGEAWEATGSIDRRELLRRGGLAAAALLLAACGVTDSTGPAAPLTVTLADFPQLAASGGVALVSPSVAVENSGGSYIALSRVCPHRGGQIQETGSGFQCPVHGATFDRTGRWIGGQPTSDMRRLSVTTNADGTLTIA